ncbi:unnamed protein product [Hydatigera taeniaeformis]|uniref:Sortilin_C domain-containing protein n=1 Tax=Hydatigena taeniaeformis TaxID=6205 RepID=A0A0R3WKJ4_HYDTA|nr:unnamed protein product [Hydatigera taeniaeformis]
MWVVRRGDGVGSVNSVDDLGRLHAAPVCGLQVSNQFSLRKRVVASPPLATSTARGLILVHGHVATHLKTTPADVFISLDGGYTWHKGLDGPHHYQIANRGGLIVAVPADTLWVDILRFSTDGGRCWHNIPLTPSIKHTPAATDEEVDEVPPTPPAEQLTSSPDGTMVQATPSPLLPMDEETVVLTGLVTEPGGRAMTVAVYGYGTVSQRWRVAVVDFANNGFITKNFLHLCGREALIVYPIWCHHLFSPVSHIQARGLHLTSEKTIRCDEAMWTPEPTGFRDRRAVHLRQTAISYAPKHGNSPTMLVRHAGYANDARQGTCIHTNSLSPGVISGQTFQVKCTSIMSALFAPHQGTAEDYEPWYPHRTDMSHKDPNDGCLLGVRETSYRLKANSLCFSNSDYRPLQSYEVCPCTEQDYECEYGYWRELDSGGKCVVNPHAPPLDVCDLVGQEVVPHLLEMIGYRLIPGDRCQGGWRPPHSNFTFEALVSHCPPKSKSFGTVGKIMVTIVALTIFFAFVGGVIWSRRRDAIFSNMSLRHRRFTEIFRRRLQRSHLGVSNDFKTNPLVSNTVFYASGDLGSAKTVASPLGTSRHLVQQITHIGIGKRSEDQLDLVANEELFVDEDTFPPDSMNDHSTRSEPGRMDDLLY